MSSLFLGVLSVPDAKAGVSSWVKAIRRSLRVLVVDMVDKETLKLHELAFTIGGLIIANALFGFQGALIWLLFLISINIGQIEINMDGKQS